MAGQHLITKLAVPKPTFKQSAPAGPDWHVSQVDGRTVVTLGGNWTALSGQIPRFPPSRFAGVASGSPVYFDTAGLGHWDTGLVAFLWDAGLAAMAAGLVINRDTLPDAAQKLLGLLPAALVSPPPVDGRAFRPLEWTGNWVIGELAGLGALSAMLATAVRGGISALGGRAHMRGIDLLSNLRAAGPAALAIVGVVNVLIGAILAFVGAVQLQKFAADTYVANLVGLAVVREMAAVMTAIVMAGRTGGAYAARIATMQGNEEIDALQVIGIPVSDYVVLPATLALVLTMPFLYLYGCLVGMAGGFAVSIAMLNVTAAGYLHQTLDAVPLDQFVFGFLKSIAFAVLIGITSCRIGLLAGRSAADVGNAATRAVVIGIVGVIAMDAVFAVIANVAGV